MPIHNIRKDKDKLFLDGFWPDYSSTDTQKSGEKFEEMIAELKEAEMHDSSKDYIKEVVDLHNNPADYHPLTGQVKPNTKSHLAREFLLRYCNFQEHELYNPLHDEPLSFSDKLNASGEFPTTKAAKLLGEIPGMEVHYQKGHDIKLSYYGRGKNLMGGSGQTGQTDANAVNQVIDMIVEEDAQHGRIHEKNKDKRRNNIKNSLYAHS